MTANVLSLQFVEDVPSERIRVRMRVGRNGPVDVEFTCAECALYPNADALFTLGFLPACELGCDLRIGGAINPTLFKQSDNIFALYAQWYGYSRKPRIIADEGTDTVSRIGRTLLFFSGGVDSCYSLHAARDRINCLVTVIGADLRASDTEGIARVRSLARDTAERFGKDFILIQTNARRWFDRMALWGEQFHGVFLTALAHMMSRSFDGALIAGSSSKEASFGRAWGSHPNHDSLYSSSAIAIENHKPVNRLDKIARLIEDMETISRLRVCYRIKDGSNCGACAKCTQTRLAIRYLGGETAARAFSCKRRDRDTIAVKTYIGYENWTSTRDAALAAGDLGMAARISTALRRYETETAVKNALRLPALARSFKRFKRRWRLRHGQLFRV